jgi:hypothetical protein
MGSDKPIQVTKTEDEIYEPDAQMPDPSNVWDIDTVPIAVPVPPHPDESEERLYSESRPASADLFEHEVPRYPWYRRIDLVAVAASVAIVGVVAALGAFVLTVTDTLP